MRNGVQSTLMVIKSWQSNWENLSSYFKYSDPMRRVIYTTNPIEGLHRQIRQDQGLIYQYKCFVQAGILCYKKGGRKVDDACT